MSHSALDYLDRPDQDQAANPYRGMDLLRFTTAGSVDDGKSTLIGRLLHDTKSVFEDQLEAVERTSEQRGEGYVNLALLTDGLRAEREQNITIDVAYRYFATPKRKFIIADTPGHVQYTRNMVTGASTAELAIILIDAQKGVSTQSKRHGFIASLLGIPHILVAINKIDLLDYDQGRFEEIREEYTQFAAKLGIEDLTFIPISALHGDNVVEKSDNTPWYNGPTLLHHLETVPVGSARNLIDFRFPVQYVLRPDPTFRGYAGRVASGTIRPGEEVVVLPSGVKTTIAAVETPNGPLDEAKAEDSVVLTTAEEVDISRGEMIVRSQNLPQINNRFDAILCWMSTEPLDLSTGYVLKHTTRDTKAYVSRLHYRVDVDTLHRQDADTLGLNDIGRVEVTTAAPIFFDPYDRNRETGGFVLVDPHSNATVAAGMIRGELRTAEEVFHTDRKERLKSPNVVWEEWNVPRAEREARNGHGAAVLWFTGLSGSGKSTVARALERALHEDGVHTMLLDGDQVRHGLCADLGFSHEDRKENIRRVGEVARLFFEAGHVVLCSFVSPFAEDRDFVRALVPADRFFEVHVDTPLEVCRERDPKGLYAKADAGEIRDFTGVSSPYEPPEDPELRIDTTGMPTGALVAQLRDAISGVVDLGSSEG
jgi:bifunctional enzyme CysN/CysC